MSISLTGSQTLLPSGVVEVGGPITSTPLSSSGTLTATVTEAGVPKAGVRVVLKDEVAALSGGHNHHDTNRPKMTGANGLTGVTDSKGEVLFNVNATEVAGTHAFAAACADCGNTATHTLHVKVPNLVQLTADTSASPLWTLRGATPGHPNNNWFTALGRRHLNKIIEYFNSFGWRPVGINDASLTWGGRFDIHNTWSGSHAEHRTGEDVDISFATAGVSDAFKQKGFDEVCRKENIAVPSTILWHQGDGYVPHFHIRLNGRYATGSQGGQSAPCIKATTPKKTK